MAIAPDEVALRAGWVFSVEGGMVAAAMGKPAPPPAALSPAQTAAALATVAAKFLAVGTPRSYGLVGAGAHGRELLAAQMSYAAPRELRVHEPTDDAASAIAAGLASPSLAARAVSLPLACACDIVVVAAPVAIRREWIRAGTLVTVLDPAATVEPALLAAADVYDLPRLARVAAGLIDGRQLDEITIVLAAAPTPSP